MWQDCYGARLFLRITICKPPLEVVAAPREMEGQPFAISRWRQAPQRGPGRCQHTADASVALRLRPIRRSTALSDLHRGEPQGWPLFHQAEFVPIRYRRSILAVPGASSSRRDVSSCATCNEVFDELRAHCESRTARRDPAFATVERSRRIPGNFRRPEIGEGIFEQAIHSRFVEIADARRATAIGRRRARIGWRGSARECFRC